MLSRSIREQAMPRALPLAAVLAAGLALLSVTPPPAPAAAEGLAAPTGLAASLENGSIRLRWVPSRGAAGYAVDCGTRAAGEDALSLVSVSPGASTALVPLLQPGLVQYCRLRATRGRQASAPSAEAHAPQLEAPWQEMRFD